MRTGLAALALALLIAAAAAAADLVRLEGTGVDAVPPHGFLVADRFPGLVHHVLATTIVVAELDAGREETLDWLDAGRLEEAGIATERVEELELPVGEARLFTLAEDGEPGDTRHWALVAGDAKRSLLVVATTPLATASIVEADAREALASLRWERDAGVELQKDQPFRVTPPLPLRVAATDKGRLELWRRDQLGPATGGATRALVTRHVVPMESPDLAYFAQAHLAESEEISSLEIDTAQETTLGGLPAIELVGRARAFDDASELVAYQSLALDGEHVYAVQGFVAADQAEALVPVFRALAKSFRRAR